MGQPGQVARLACCISCDNSLSGLLQPCVVTVVGSIPGQAGRGLVWAHLDSTLQEPVDQNAVVWIGMGKERVLINAPAYSMSQLRSSRLR